MAITYSNVQVTKVLTLRGNTIQNNRYTGLPGELTVDTEAKTIRIHDGVTPGGNTVQGSGGASNYSNANVKVYLTNFDGNIVPSANVTYSLGSPTRQWKDLFVSNNTIYVGGVPLGIDATGNLTINGNVIPTISYVNTVVANVTVDLSSYALNANVTAANVGLKGYVDQANTIQSAQLTSANLGIIGYIDQANTIQSAQISAANVGMRGYVDQANTIQSAQVGAANLAITAANVGLKGYVDQANTIQSSQVNAANLAITAANVGMKGYVDSQSFYSNVKVSTYLPTYTGNIAANISKAGYTWTFGSDAVLTLPSGGTILESGYLSAGAIRLKPNGGTSTQYLEIAPTAVDGNHVHLMAGSGTELFLGDDNQYVKLANTGGVVINSNDGAGNTAQWTFGKTGTTQFPGSMILAPVSQSITMQSDQYSQLMWQNANVTVAPDKATYSNFYVAQNSAVLDIGYRDGSSNEQFKEWLWNVDGNLTLPSGGYILNSDNSIYGGSSYSNVQVATYLPTYSGNIANLTLGPSGVLTFADGTTQITAGGGSYSNVQVATYLPTYAGTVSASLVNTLGNILSSGLSVFGNTRIGLAGAVSGQFHTVVGNITQTSSGGAVYINTTGNVLAAAVVAGAVTSTGTVAVNAATGITTNQATFLLANATATTINMGGAATTINLGTTASATGNVFVGGQIGSNAYNLTLRANGQYNIASSINSNGGFNSPPYANQAVIGGTGTGMTANYSATGGYLTTLTIYNVGTGYRNGDVISVPGGIAGNSFVLQNYNSGRTGTGTALYTFGIDGNLTVPGNITAARFIGDGSLLTSLPGYAYSNVNVAAYLNTQGYNLYSNVNVASYLSGNVTLGIDTGTTNIYGNLIITTSPFGNNPSGEIEVRGNIIQRTNTTPYYINTAGNLIVGGNVSIGGTLSTAGNITAGNVTAQYFVGNGSLLTGIVASSSYSNVQVATYLPTYSGNVANIRLGVSGVLTFPDGTTMITASAGGGSSYSNVNVAAYLTTYGGAIQSSNVQTTTANIQALTASTNNATGALRVMGGAGIRGNLNVGSLDIPGALHTIVGNVNVTGAGTEYFNIAGNIIAIQGSFGSINTTGAINTTGNILASSIVGTISTASQTAITQVGTLATLTVSGNATVGNLVGNEANTRIIANTYVTTFDIYGNVTFPANVIATNFVGSGSLLSGVAIKTTGSWTVPTGNSTQSFTVPASGTYQLWVDCNIPNGILAWNAIATVTNTNVPVVGAQYAWVYNGGGTPIDFTSIPNQFVGTGNTIVRSSASPSVTTNRFDFGINNTSGGNVTVRYGYVSIS